MDDSDEDMPAAPATARAQLAALLSDPDFTHLDNGLDVFCPFEAIGMVNQEIRHAQFLEYLFDPKRPHGLGARALRAFLELVAAIEVEDDLPPFDELTLFLTELEGAEIRREWNRVDLLIVVPPDRSGTKTVITIEIKVKAVEGKDQLSRYAKAVRKEFPECRYRWVFLTLEGTDASDEARVKEDWLPVGFDTLVSALESLPESLPDANVSYLLKAYVAMMRRWHLEDEEMEAIARKLWQTHRPVLERLMDARPTPMRDLLDAVTDPTQLPEIYKLLHEDAQALGFRNDRGTAGEKRFSFLRVGETLSPPTFRWLNEGGNCAVMLQPREDKSGSVRIVWGRLQFGPPADETRNAVIRRLIGKNFKLSSKKNWENRDWVAFDRVKLIDEKQYQSLLLDNDKHPEALKQLTLKLAELVNRYAPALKAAIDETQDHPS